MNLLSSTKNVVALLLLGIGVAAAEKPLLQWSFDQENELAKCESRNGAVVKSAGLVAPGGAAAITVTLPAQKQQWPPTVAFGADSSLPRTAMVQISFQARSSAPCRMRLTVSNFAPPHDYFTAPQRIELTTEWQIFSLNFKINLAATAKVQKINLPIMVFEDYRESTEVWISGLTVTAGTPPKPQAAANATVRIIASAAWQPLDTRELYIRKGSALDLTAITDRAPSGSYGRVIANSRGELAFEKKPDQAIRFFSLQLSSETQLANATRPEMAEYAAAIARQGYNMVRMHFLDSYLVRSSRGAALKNLKKARAYPLQETAEEIKFDPERLDDFFFFMAELKKNGIYLNLDLMSSFVGYDNGRLRELDKTGDYNTKVQLFINPSFRRNWKAGVTAFLNKTNPYTGMTLRDDPAVALAVCLNEQEILLDFRDYGAAFQAEWILWLQRKYTDYQQLYQAWGGKCGSVTLPEKGSFAQVPGIGREVFKNTPAGCDMAKFCGEKEVEMSRFYLDAIKEIGFPGLTSNWNMRTRLCSVPARSLFPMITMNCYHAHPSYGEDKPAVSQASALSEAGNSFKSQTVARFLDRPFVNTEFGIVFWNPYRHEQGLLYGAGAALQGWSGLNCHADQVTSGGSVLRWFDTGYDPVIRASELMTAFAFLRGDVKASEHTIEIPVNDDFIFDGRAMRTVSDELSRLWPICRVGITYGKKQVDYPVSLTVRPDKTSGVGGGVMFTTVENSATVDDLEAAVRALRQRGVLSPENRTNPSKGIFQSDTGEILLDTNSGGELLVTTPRLEGAVIKKNRPVKLAALKIESCSVPAAIAAISLDPVSSLAAAPRRLLVFSTNALNSEMIFTDARQNRLAELGHLPVLVQTGTLRLTLADTSAGPGRFRCFALKLNGDRAEEIPLSVKDGQLLLEINTSKLVKSGPTPFFEIVKVNDRP